MYFHLFDNSQENGCPTVFQVLWSDLVFGISCRWLELVALICVAVVSVCSGKKCLFHLKMGNGQSVDAIVVKLLGTTVSFLIKALSIQTVYSKMKMN